MKLFKLKTIREKACVKHLESLRWRNNIVVSPFDETSIVYKCAGNRYKCKNTGKYFNVKTGTIFENTKIPLQKWFLALYYFSRSKQKISSYKLAAKIKTSQRTANLLIQKLKYAFNHSKFKKAIA